MRSFQQIILTLQDYWDRQGCALLQPYDMEVGAGTSHTATFLRAIGPEPWKAAYVQPSRRPKDGRYGENPNRLQHYYQYQVVLKPAPANILELYLGSLEALGFDLKQNDVRFVEDDWENPTLGCWGLGWEVWLNGMEVTQFTYFQQVGGIDCKPITGEITYGLERLAMYIQGVESLFDLQWAEGISYRDVYHQNEVEQSAYNFEHSDVEFLLHGLQRARAAEQAPDGAAAGPAGLRAVAQGRAQLQPARCARCHQRDRARGLHRPHPQPGARRGAGLPGQPCAPGLPDGAAGLGRRGECGLGKEGGVSMTAKNLLVELFVEELPPKALKKLGEAFAEGLAASLKAQGLADADAVVTGYATPRRLAVHVTRVLDRAADQSAADQADACVGGAGRTGPADHGVAEEAGRHRRRRHAAGTIAARGRRQVRNVVPEQPCAGCDAAPKVCKRRSTTACPGCRSPS